MTSISKNAYIDKLDDIVNKYNNTYNSTIKMKPIDVKNNTYIGFDKKAIIKILNLTLKRLGGSQIDPPPPLPCSFSKIVSSKQRLKPWFFVTFKIIIRHVFPENFIEILQVI